MSELAGTGTLVRLILRRDRWLLVAWIGLAALLAWASASSFSQLYPTTEALRAYAAETAGNPVVVALLGPVFAPSVGGLVAWRWSMQGLFVAGVASVITVVRHTRGDEEAGRRELLGATVVGRQAPLAAALLAAGAANLLMAAVVAIGLSELGLPIVGSAALGLSVAAAGGVVAVLAGLAAQLASTAGGARALAMGALGLLYLLRAIGDVVGPAGGPGWLAWLSPIGWLRFVRPFAGEQWWVFGLFVGATAAFCLLAYWLSRKRDLGQGLLPERSGPAGAAPTLNNPITLAWRLQRGMLLTWVATFAVVGIAFGYVARTVAALLGLNPGLLGFFTSISASAPPSDVVFHLYFLTFGPIVAIYAIMATQRVRSEEVAMRADPVLAAAVTRAQFLCGHLLVAALGPVAILGVLGLTAGLTYGSGTGDLMPGLMRVLAGAIIYLPAVWVVAGIATLQVGRAPRLAYLTWVAWLVFGIVDFAHERQFVSAGVYAISPFAHVPNVLLREPVALAPLIVSAVLAALLVIIGVRAFERRDVG